MPLYNKNKSGTMRSFEVKGVTKRFEGVVALKEAEVKFEGPKVCGLVGANGSGKTTFARICAGEIKPDTAHFIFDGEKAIIRSPADAKKYGIVLVHQHLSLIPELSVWENINLGNEVRKGIFTNNKIAKENAIKIINELGQSDISIESKVVDLTPEGKQMVEIAKALLQEPKLLILDEPTASLEYFHVEQLFKKIKELKKGKISIIFISHRLWEITKICDIVFAFSNGKSVGTVDFEKQPRDENLIIPLVTGSKKGYTTYLQKEKGQLEKAKVVLELKDISYEKKLQNISFSVKKGEVLGIGGLAGQGQEELLLILAGVISPTNGQIVVNDIEVKIKHPKDIIKKDVFLIPGDRQRDGLFMNHSIFENVIYPRFPMKRDRFILNYKKLTAITKEVMEKIQVTPPEIRNLIKNLSGGNQQKVVFAKWLQFTPKILLLNDPAKGIDIQSKNLLYRFVHELSKDGTTGILYSSDNEELICNCNRVLIMFEGQIVDELIGDEISEEKIIESSLRIGSKN